MRTVVLGAVLGWAAVAAEPLVAQEHFWPNVGRNQQRQSNAPWPGPRTPTVAWSVDVAAGWQRSTPVIDNRWRVYVLGQRGVRCLDGVSGEVIWSQPYPSLLLLSGLGPCLQGDRLYHQYWNGDLPDAMQCRRLSDGEIIWEALDDPSLVHIPVAGRQGPVFHSSTSRFWARDALTGKELWARGYDGLLFGSPSLSARGDVLFAPYIGSTLEKRSAVDGALIWSTPLRGLPEQGMAAIDEDVGPNGQVYRDSNNGWFAAFDLATGEELWTYRTNNTMSGAVAVGLDHTVFGTSSNGLVFALTPDGEEIWAQNIGVQMKFSPVVDSHGDLYVAGILNAFYGRLFCFRPDGSIQFTLDFPARIGATPAIAPDGTLYIGCEDGFLYAIRDPCRVDLDKDGRVDGADFLLFLILFFEGSPRADFDRSAAVDGGDFLLFLSLFGDGC